MWEWILDNPILFPGLVQLPLGGGLVLQVAEVSTGTAWDQTVTQAAIGSIYVRTQLAGGGPATHYNERFVIKREPYTYHDGFHDPYRLAVFNRFTLPGGNIRDEPVGAVEGAQADWLRLNAGLGGAAAAALEGFYHLMPAYPGDATAPGGAAPPLHAHLVGVFEATNPQFIQQQELAAGADGAAGKWELFIQLDAGPPEAGQPPAPPGPPLFTGGLGIPGSDEEGGWDSDEEGEGEEEEEGSSDGEEGSWGSEDPVEPEDKGWSGMKDGGGGEEGGEGAESAPPAVAGEEPSPDDEELSTSSSADDED